MLQFRKSLASITTSLRTHNVAVGSRGYRWGYLAKLLVQHQDVTHQITSIEDGTRNLQTWGIPMPKPQRQDRPKVPRLTQKLTHT
ncbi:Hypothetical predicted protein [Pelobates cultripes]|uniref:Uncharacterized protein n=1 Tax=Pelobates cultripes TaxID=61616 RepID=A0AAD1RL97_PELCU|nr:Hypothetical predicted protein [Pelobates cultripes]